MRVFTGIKITPELVESINREIICNLAKKVREARIVPGENLHVTLKFLGDINENQLLQVKRSLEEATGCITPFTLSVSGIGVFPDAASTRVLWLGADSGGCIKSLHALIEEKMRVQGFKEDNRFKEHITIARFKSVPKVTLIEELLEKYRETQFGTMYVQAMNIMQSRLNAKGPVYTTLHEIPFKQGPGDN